MANDMNSAVQMLQELLSSPDAGEKLGDMLSMFTAPHDAEASDAPGTGDGAASGSSLDGDTLPVGAIMNLASAYGQLSKQDDPRITLLNAIRPYLQRHRHNNLEQAVKVLKLLKLLPLLGDLKGII